MDNTLRTIGQKIEQHFKENPDHGYDCTCMDEYVRQWHAYIQEAKPNADVGSEVWRAFRYILVTGERDY